MFDWSSDVLMALLGTILSLFFAYFPWVRDWFDSLDPRWKPLVNLGILLLVTLGRLLWLCQAELSCMQLELPAALGGFFAAAFANVATFNYAVKQFKHAMRVAKLRASIRD